MDLQPIVRRIFDDVISKGDLADVDQLIAEDYTDPRGPKGREGFAMGLEMVRSAFPDWTSRIQETVVDGDVVAARWVVTGTHQAEFMGIPATGKRIEMQECGFLQFRDGQLVEIRRVADELGMLRQLGALP